MSAAPPNWAPDDSPPPPPPPPPQRPSQAGKAEAPHNRKRRTLSCEQCRSRKRRCDRTEPCSSCMARGDRCVWLRGAPVGPHFNCRHHGAEIRRLRRLVGVLQGQCGMSDEAVRDLEMSLASDDDEGASPAPSSSAWSVAGPSATTPVSRAGSSPPDYARPRPRGPSLPNSMPPPPGADLFTPTASAFVARQDYSTFSYPPPVYAQPPTLPLPRVGHQIAHYALAGSLPPPPPSMQNLQRSPPRWLPPTSQQQQPMPTRGPSLPPLMPLPLPRLSSPPRLPSPPRVPSSSSPPQQLPTTTTGAPTLQALPVGTAHHPSPQRVRRMLDEWLTDP